MQCVRRMFRPGRRLLSNPAIPPRCTRLFSTRSQPNSGKFFASATTTATWIAGGGAVAALTWVVLYRGRRSHNQSAACATEQEQQQQQQLPNGSPPPRHHPPGEVVEGLPDYSLDEVSKHVTRDGGQGVWVTYRDGVYDITEFASQHPGGDEKILLAKGGAIDPFWEVFPVHATDETLDLLETMRIGNVGAPDRAKRREAAALSQEKKEGPFANEPRRSPVLKVHTSEPFNAETPSPLLVDHYTTPTDIFYVRNHLPVPEVDPSDYALEVSGEGLVPTRLTLADLKTKFEQRTVVAALQCTGNRRSDLQTVKPIKGLPWSVGAIGNAEWRGVRLRDVLVHAGLEDPDFDGHVHFEGLDRNAATGECYGASVPARAVLDPRGDDVLLAYAMNGEDLTRDHGYPLRAILPGITGARNVKWLGRVRTSREEYGGFWQQRDYKSFSPSVDWDNVDFSKAPAIQETPVQSAICSPQDGVVLLAGTRDVTLRGYAYSGGGRGIVRVDVSADGGKTWHEAGLRDGASQDPYRAWAWVLWEANVPLPPAAVAGTSQEKNEQQVVEVCCRAVDRSYNTQPEFPGPIWNLRGVLANSWHRVRLRRPVETTTEAGPHAPQQQQASPASPEVR